MKCLSWKLLVLAAVVVSGVAVAQGEVSPALDEIVVTATRYESARGDVARSISVVDSALWQSAAQQFGFDEALAGVPGLYIQGRDNFSQDLRLSLRGFGARSSFGIRGIRIFVDGIPESLPDGQAQVDSIDIGSAQRVEVLRGPASALYGNAAGGVISVISELGATQPYAELRAVGGDYDFQRIQLKSAGQVASADYLVNLATQRVDGYRDHSRAESDSINAKLGIDLSAVDRLIVSGKHCGPAIGRGSRWHQRAAGGRRSVIRT